MRPSLPVAAAFAALVLAGPDASAGSGPRNVSASPQARERGVRIDPAPTGSTGDPAAKAPAAATPAAPAAKPSAAKPSDPKPADAKPADAKPADGAPPSAEPPKKLPPLPGATSSGGQDQRFRAGMRPFVRPSAEPPPQPKPEATPAGVDLPVFGGGGADAPRPGPAFQRLN